MLNRQLLRRIYTPGQNGALSLRVLSSLEKAKNHTKFVFVVLTVPVSFAPFTEFQVENRS